MWEWIISPAHASPSPSPSYSPFRTIYYFLQGRFRKQIMQYTGAARGSIVRGQSPLAGVGGEAPWSLSFLGAIIVITALTEYVFLFLKLATEKLTLKLLMHENSLFSHISPSFIEAGASCPHPHRSMKAYISTKEEIMTTWFLYVSLSLSPFLFFPFLSLCPLFFFLAEEGGRARPRIRAWFQYLGPEVYFFPSWYPKGKHHPAKFLHNRKSHYWMLCFAWTWESRLFLIFVTFTMKKEAKRLARSTKQSVAGRSQMSNWAMHWEH